MTPTLAAAYALHRTLGARLVPVPRRTKAPLLEGWQSLRLEEPDFPRYFDNGNGLGILTGEPSATGDPPAGLVDIDVDAAEAVLLAPCFLPSTARVHGRPSKRASHWWYRVAPAPPTRKWKDPLARDDEPDDKGMLVELRSTGCQTVVPPSLHPSGEALEWEREGEPAPVGAETLHAACARLGTAALLARRWPGTGTRHDFSLALSGFLLQAGLEMSTASRLVEGAARAAGDPEWSDRTRAVRDTAAKLAAGEPVTGAPTLADFLVDAERVTRKIREWLGLRGSGGGLQAEHLTDTGNARRFARQHGADVRYVYAWRTWLLWSGTHWRRDPGDGVMRLAKATAHAIYREAAEAADEEARKRLAGWAVKSESEPALRRLLILAQSEPGIAVTPVQLDADPFLLNTPSGTVELRGLRLRPHRREDLLAKITAAPYAPGATHPVFDAFLARVLPDEDTRRFVQRVAGYACTGSTAEEKIPFAHGPTAGGKSTLLKAMRKTLGDYAAVADFATFCERSHDGPREDIARLAGVRLVVSVEVKDGTRLAEGLVKWLSGGDDIAARRLYEQTFEFTPQFKLLLAANHRPRVRDDDEALWRRLVEIPFPVSIPEGERDPTVKATLCDPDRAGAAILAWMVDGARQWLESGLAAPVAVRQATIEYRQAMDPLDDFLVECCVLAPEAVVAVKELRAAYDDWAKENRVRYPLTSKDLADRLRGRTCQPTRIGHKSERAWRGVRLRTPEDPEPSPAGGAADTQTDAGTTSESRYTRAQERSYGSTVGSVGSVGHSMTGDRS